MVKLILFAGAALAALVSHGNAHEITDGVVGMIVARDVCPAGTINDNRLADLIQVSAVINKEPVGDHVLALTARAWVQKDRVLHHGSVDAFCRDVARITSSRTLGN